MKRTLGILAVAAALSIPVVAQSGYPYPDRDPDRDYSRDRDNGYQGEWQGRMSADDQREFDDHYRKWQDARAKNDRDDIEKHARKMNEIMSRYNIPQDTPFDVMATTNGYGRGGSYSRQYDARDYQRRFSPDDQKRFDKAYENWLHERREGDRRDLAKAEDRMQEIMARYNIPRDVPYDMLTSGGRGYY